MTVACFGEGLLVLVQDEPGPLEDCGTFRRSIGGAEINVAIGLVAEGVPAAVVSRVGADGFGRHLTQTLAEHGVDVTGVLSDAERPTGMYVKEVGGFSGRPTDLGPGASRMHYYRTGSAASALSPADLTRPEISGILNRAHLIHTTGITPALSDSALAATTALVAGRRPGQLVSFDLNWRPNLWRGREEFAAQALAGFIRAADIVFLGAPEALAVFGTGSPLQLRRLFPEPRWLVIKNDGNEATGFDGERRSDIPALTIDVVESIGAGDAFAAGFLAGMDANLPLESSLQRAHTSAARALGSVGDHAGHRGRP